MEPTNYALPILGAVALCSNLSGSLPPSNIIDGDDATYMRNLVTPMTNGWVGVDLNATPYIQRIRLLQSGTGANAASQYKVEYSNDNATWTEALTRNAAGTDDIYEIIPAQARYWRFTPLVGGGSYWFVHTLELIGTVDAPPPTVGGIKAWLTYLKNTYVTDADEWLAEN